MKYINENDLKYYIISEGDKLYRGDTEAHRSNRRDLIPGKKCFFAMNEATAATYGVVLEYTVGREYKLLALDDANTKKHIHKEAPKHIQSILEKNYGYTSGIRNSVSKPDNELADFLCEQGFEGYAINHMKTDFDGKFHPEAMICDTSGLTFSRTVSSESEIKQFISDEALRNAAPKRKNKSSRKSPSPSPKKNAKRGLFGSKISSPLRTQLFSFDSPNKGGRRTKKQLLSLYK